AILKAFTGLLSACAKEFRAKGWSVGSIGSQNPRRELTPFLQSSFMRKKCSKYFFFVLRKKLSVYWIRSSVGGVLSVSYHSCSGKDPQLSKGPPTARITIV
ncbi:unnamed protein product, partial [Sphenostylis stenocarpa]